MHIRFQWCVWLMSLMVWTGMVPADERPNFIFYITDDVSAEDLGCYGHPTIQTPHLDRMAAEGLVFDQAYLSISSCSPSRCSIITGRYPHNTGAAELHTSLPAGQVLFPELLKQAGYYTLLSGKHHMGPNANRGFDVVNKGKGPGKQETWVSLLRDRPKDKPFFFWLASTDAHRGWTLNGDAPVYTEEDAVVPPYLVDGPLTRADLAKYYHEVSRTDTFAGRLRAELERQGVAENTYVIYCSDNGRPFPRGKTRLYDDGIKTPLIVWAPGRVEPGRTSSLVSSIDIGPTLLELAGVTKDPRIQGQSFVPVLDDPAAVSREVVFAEHNWHVYQAHERLVRQGDWLYIRNAWPERQNLCVEATPNNPSGEELWQTEKEGKLGPDQRDIFLQPRPAEELYHVLVDPDQLHNMAGVADHRNVLKKMRTLLDQWTRETGDTVSSDPTPDRETVQRVKHPGWKHRVQPGVEAGALEINHPGPIRL